MSDTKIIHIIQTVHVDHNETVERSWYDVVERTIERSIDDEGNILSDEIIDEVVIEEGLEVEEDWLFRLDLEAPSIGRVENGAYESS
jgi:hypothetical protein